MKISGAKAAAYFARPDPTHLGILIFGADSMRVSLRRQEVIKAIIGDKGEEEMRLTRLAGSEIRKEPSLVLDGMKARGFFPGSCVVLVEQANDGLAAILDIALQEAHKTDAKLIVTAGQLNQRSKLRKVFEGTKSTVAIGIYNDPPSKQEIENVLRKTNLVNISSEALSDLHILGQSLDPGDFQQTMEKLSLYKYGDDTELSSKDVEACAPVTLDAGIDDVIHVIAEARVSEVALLLKRLLGQGINPTTLCISATRHFRLLHSAISHPKGADTALAYARPPVFGARKERMSRQARNWGGLRLEKVLNVLLDTDLVLRSSRPVPANAMIERAFIRIAMLCPKS